MQSASDENGRVENRYWRIVSGVVMTTTIARMLCEKGGVFSLVPVSGNAGSWLKARLKEA